MTGYECVWSAMTRYSNDVWPGITGHDCVWYIIIRLGMTGYGRVSMGMNGYDQVWLCMTWCDRRCPYMTGYN